MSAAVPSPAAAGDAGLETSSLSDLSLIAFLISQRILGAVEEFVDAEPYGEMNLKGFPRAVAPHNVIRLKAPSSAG